jgi:ectoine hydroxylase-related dioxygenase (phytanoyl-CoA dioxygenase family)
MPVYDITPDNGLAIHPGYWNKAIKNSSNGFNYYRWNGERKTASKHIGKDTRQQPKPEEPLQLDPQVRLILPPGGIVVFSAAHLHSSVPNTSGYTRFSIDFRTVCKTDVKERIGAPNIDSECTGTTMRDYLSCENLSHLPDDLVAMYDTGPRDEGVLLYEPEVAAKTAM